MNVFNLLFMFSYFSFIKLCNVIICPTLASDVIFNPKLLREYITITCHAELFVFIVQPFEVWIQKRNFHLQLGFFHNDIFYQLTSNIKHKLYTYCAMPYKLQCILGRLPQVGFHSISRHPSWMWWWLLWCPCARTLWRWWQSHCLLPWSAHTAVQPGWR